MRHALRVLACALTLGTCAATHGASIAVVNPSFEADFAPAGGFPVFPAAVAPQGWSVYDPKSILNGSGNSLGTLNPAGTTFFADPVPDGSNVALVYLADTPGAGPAGITQTLSATLQANTRYTLTVEIGNIASGTGLGAFAPYGFFNLAGFPGYRVELLAGGTPIAVDADSLGATLAEGRFGLSTVQVDIGASHAALGQSLGIRLINLNQAGTPSAPAIEVDFDDVRLTAMPVPEPRTWALFAAGFACLTAFARRRAREA